MERSGQTGMPYHSICHYLGLMCWPMLSPSNPFYGHALERSWAFMFGCDDPSIEKLCAYNERVWRGCVCEG
jgi:hypothetical protein